MASGIPKSGALDTDRARAWAAMRNFGQRRDVFTLAQLQIVIQEDPGSPIRRSKNLGEYLLHLERGGYLRRVSEGRERSWRLMRDVGPLPPMASRDGRIFNPNPDQRSSAGTMRMLLWQAMRECGRRDAAFTVDELYAEIRSAPGMKSKGRANALSYVTRLARAGYLERLSEAREFVWRLARDSGPQTPVPRQEGGVFDPNTGETHMEGRILAFEGADAGRIRA